MLSKILAAAALAALTLPTAALAQGVTGEPVIIVGAIHDPANTQNVQDPADSAIPQLPVVYDDSSAGQTQASASAASAAVSSQPAS